MKKIGTTLPLRTSPLFPNQPRATTNSLCRTNLRQNNKFLSSKTIQIGNTLISIPCFLLTHIPEFTTLTAQVGYIQAVKILAIKYNVNIQPTIQHVHRYFYPKVDIGVLPPVIQFSISIKLGEKVGVITNSGSLPVLPRFSVMMNDARYLSVCNDDTTTFSHTYTDMKSFSKYWVSKLPIFDEPFYFTIVNSTVTPLNAHSGCLLLRNDRIIFVPVIFNPLFLFYTAYTENTSINILFIGSQTLLHDKILDFYADVKNSCEFKKKYARWISGARLDLLE